MKSLLGKTDRSSRKMPVGLGLAAALLLVGVPVASYSHRGNASKVQEKGSPAPASSKLTQAKIKDTVGKLALSFEPNRGQIDAPVKYIARASGYTAMLTADGATMRIKGSEPGVLQMRLRNAQSASQIAPSDLQPGKSNYLIGDRSKWITEVPHYGQVRYAGVYRGIDMVFSGNQRDLEYDFVVKPGADPKQIRVAYEGSSRFELNAAGDLELQTVAGTTVSRKPVVYQTVKGSRKLVSAEYALLGNHEVAFNLGAYDASLPLVIDPVVNAIAYIGGTGDDDAYGIAANATGIYLTGKTASTAVLANATALPNPIVSSGFPLTPGTCTKTTPNTYPSTAGACLAASPAGNAGLENTGTPAYAANHGGPNGYDAFVTQLKQDGNGYSYVQYSTFLGGSYDDAGQAVAVDASGNAYVTGWTFSVSLAGTDVPFPTAPAITSSPGGNEVAFLTKIGATGATIPYSVLLGAASTTTGLAIALDSSANAYIGGLTSAAALTSPASAIQGGLYGGGPSDGFVAKYSATGTLTSAAYIGGPGSDQVTGVAVDATGIYVAGTTTTPTNLGTASLGFPTTNGGLYTTAGGTNGFVAKTSLTFSSLTYSQTFGGGNETVNGLATDPSGNTYIVGSSSSGNLSFGATQTPLKVTGMPPTGAIGAPVIGIAPNAGSTAGYLLSLNSTASKVNFIDFGPQVFASSGVSLSTPTPGTTITTTSGAGSFNGVAVDANLLQVYVVGTAYDYVAYNSGVDTVALRFSSTGNGYSTAASQVGIAVPGGIAAAALVATVGGSGFDSGNAIAVNATDEAFIAGNTSGAIQFNEAVQTAPFGVSATQAAPGTTIVVNTNPLGVIHVGDSVQGPNMPNNTEVTAIAGTTITLSNTPSPAFPTVGGQAVYFVGSTAAIVSTTANAASGVTTITLGTSTGVLIGETITGTGIPAGTTITSAPVAAAPIVTTLSNATTTGATSITVPSAATGILVGQTVTGAGFAGGTTVTSVTATAPLTTTAYQPIVGSANILINSATGVLVGQTVTGTGIPASTTVTGFGAGANFVGTINTPTPVGSTSINLAAIGTVAIGQAVSGVGIASGTTVTNIGGAGNVALSALTTGALGTGSLVTFTGTTVNISNPTTAALNNSNVSFTLGTTTIGLSAATTANQLAGAGVTFSGGFNVNISAATTVALTGTPVSLVDTTATLTLGGVNQPLPVTTTSTTTSYFNGGLLRNNIGNLIGTTNSGGANDAFYVGVQFQDFTVPSPPVTFQVPTGSPAGFIPASQTFSAQYLLGLPSIIGGCANVSLGPAITAPTANTIPPLPSVNGIPTATASVGSFAAVYNAGSTQSYTVSIVSVPAIPGTYVANLTLGPTGCTDNAVTIQLTLVVNSNFTATPQTPINLTEAFGSGIITGLNNTPATGYYVYDPIAVTASTTAITYSAAIVNNPLVPATLPTYVPANGSATVTGAGAIPPCFSFVPTPATVPYITPAPPGTAVNGAAFFNGNAGTTPGAPAFDLEVAPAINPNGTVNCPLATGLYTGYIGVVSSVGTVNIPYSFTITPGVTAPAAAPIIDTFISNTAPAQANPVVIAVTSINAGTFTYTATYTPNGVCTTLNCPVSFGAGVNLPAANVSITSGGSGTVSAQGTIAMNIQICPGPTGSNCVGSGATALSTGFAYGGTITIAPNYGTASFAPVTINVLATVGGGLISASPAGGNLTLTLPVGYPTLPVPANILPAAFGSGTPGLVWLIDGQPGPPAATSTIAVNGPTANGPSQPAGITVAGTGSNPLPSGTLILALPNQNPASTSALTGGPFNGGTTPGTTTTYFTPGAVNGYYLSFNTIGLTPGATYTGAISFSGCTDTAVTGNVPCTNTTTVTATQTINVSLTIANQSSIFGVNNPANGTNQTPLLPGGITLTGVVGQTTICTNTPGQLLADPTFFTNGGTLGNALFTVTAGNFITYPITGLPNPLAGAGGALLTPQTLNTFGVGGPAPISTGLEFCVNPQLVGSTAGIYQGAVTLSAAGAAASLVIPVTMILTNTPGHIDLPDIGVYRSGTFFEDLNDTTYSYSLASTITATFGLPGDQPIAGDWMGTGVVSVGVYRPSTAAFYFDLNNDGLFEPNEGPFYFGLPNDVAVVGDWTGSGSTKVGVFRLGTWYLNTTTLPVGSTPGTTTVAVGSSLYNPATTLQYTFGFPTDQPVVSNWSQTGNVDQIGVFRCTTTCQWIVDNVGDGMFRTTDPVYNFFGAPGDIAVTGDWNGLGKPKKIGVFRPSSATWYLDVNGSNQAAPNDIQAQFGLPTDKPVIGQFTN